MNAAERTAIIYALDALELGDQDAAAATLLSALEDGVRVARCRCVVCDADFEWPGQLDRHRGLVHGVWE